MSTAALELPASSSCWDQSLFPFSSLRSQGDCQGPPEEVLSSKRTPHPNSLVEGRFEIGIKFSLSKDESVSFLLPCLEPSEEFSSLLLGSIMFKNHLHIYQLITECLSYAWHPSKCLEESKGYRHNPCLQETDALSQVGRKAVLDNIFSVMVSPNTRSYSCST